MPIIAPSSEVSGTFPCPNCNEFIGADVAQCRYCSASIPADFARSATEAQDKINKACDEAGWLRAFTGAMWVFFFLRLVPFIGLIAWIVMMLAFLSAPFWLIYWRVRFGRIKTPDVDYRRAKRNWRISVGLWVLMLAVFVVPIILSWWFFRLATRS